jgi:hypothetical protein
MSEELSSHKPLPASPGLAWEGNKLKKRVVVTMPPNTFFDDQDPPPDEFAIRLATQLFKQALREVLDLVVEGGPAKSTAARVAAMRHHFKHDLRPLAVIAKSAGTSKPNLIRLLKKLPAKLTAF